MLQYRLFQLHLIAHLVWLSLHNASYSLKKRASFIAVCLLFTMTVGLLLNQVISKDGVILNETVSAAQPPRFFSQVNQEQLEPSEIQARINNLEELLEQQPTHFDVLINIALLYQANGNQEKADQYWNKAKSLNPNDPIFKQ